MYVCMYVYTYMSNMCIYVFMYTYMYMHKYILHMDVCTYGCMHRVLISSCVTASTVQPGPASSELPVALIWKPRDETEKRMTRPRMGIARAAILAVVCQRSLHVILRISSLPSPSFLQGSLNSRIHPGPSEAPRQLQVTLTFRAVDSDDRAPASCRSRDVSSIYI